MAISSWKRSFQIRQLFIQKTKVKHILIAFQLTLFSPGRHSKWEKAYLTTYCLPASHSLKSSRIWTWGGGGGGGAGTSDKAEVQCFMIMETIFFSNIIL